MAAAVSSSDTVTSTNITEAIGDLARLVIRQEVDSADGQGWDALGMIFRFVRSFFLLFLIVGLMENVLVLLP